ncbi:MAG: tetratricopeptide repeat protein [Betaproteobacteria bacterium]
MAADPARPVSRNAACPCGSGRRYKDCHGRLESGHGDHAAPPVAGPALPADPAGPVAPAGPAGPVGPVGPASEKPPDPALLRALALQRAGRSAEAEALYRAVLQREPERFDALHMLGLLRHQAGELDEAIALLRRAIGINALHAPAHSNLTLALTAKRAFAQALASIERALALEPRFVEALNNRGTLLQAQARHTEALASFDAALAQAPDHPELLSNRGNALLELRRHDEAARCFARLVAIAPDHPWARGYLYQTKMLCCDWSSIEALAEDIRAAVHAGRRAIAPFVHLAASDSPADQLRAARIQAAEHARVPLVMGTVGLRYAHDRIRLAYLSADFREHPVAHLASHLFETHDRSRFEVTALSFGPDTGDPMRRRLERAFDRFVDVRARADAEIAALMRQYEIDIAVDLMGYTSNGRPGILARRGAPVQVAYLGYPGTQGSAAIDYILADANVIPAGEEVHYAERVVRLPGSYFVHDPTRAVGEPPSRAQAGLPPHAFVFCCFNNNYKIAPPTFDAWMRVLARVDNSVLWLLAPDDVAQRNLRDEAAHRCVDPSRIVFADRTTGEAHLGRHGLADLFLDTHHYNAHTTALDALWAGLPVLTYAGTTMAGRVATALLRAIGLPELIARDRNDYEARAVELARAPATLSEIRARLARHRDSHPLFDAVGSRGAIEAAYQAMHARNEAGEAPAAFDVAPDGAIEVRG